MLMLIILALFINKNPMKNQNKAVRKRENQAKLLPKSIQSYEDITLINPKKEPHTPSILRSFEGFQAISEEEAENICRTSLLFAQVLLELIAQKNTNTIDNQHVVN